jgi:hypothetical protein
MAEIDGLRKAMTQSPIAAELQFAMDRLQELLAEEPFIKAKKMRFSPITEFNPVQHRPVLRQWFAQP